MITLRHPTAPRAVKHVPESEVAAWVAQGWIAPVPESVPAIASPSTAARKAGAKIPATVAKGVKSPQSGDGKR